MKEFARITRHVESDGWVIRLTRRMHDGRRFIGKIKVEWVEVDPTALTPNEGIIVENLDLWSNTNEDSKAMGEAARMKEEISWLRGLVERLMKV